VRIRHIYQKNESLSAFINTILHYHIFFPIIFSFILFSFIF